MSKFSNAEITAKIEKLPVWAKSYIGGLEDRLEAAIAVADERTNIDADGWTDVYTEFPRPSVPTGEMVRFPLGLRDDIHIDVKRAGDALEIRAQHGLSVKPLASNVVVVSVPDPWG